jgi:hypothetical protein
LWSCNKRELEAEVNKQTSRRTEYMDNRRRPGGQGTPPHYRPPASKADGDTWGDRSLTLPVGNYYVVPRRIGYRSGEPGQAVEGWDRGGVNGYPLTDESVQWEGRLVEVTRANGAHLRQAKQAGRFFFLSPSLALLAGGWLIRAYQGANVGGRSLASGRSPSPRAENRQGGGPGGKSALKIQGVV